MRTEVQVCRVFGIPIQLHVSWLVIAGLLISSLAQMFAEVRPSWSQSQRWLVAVATAALFFVCLLLHELSHALVARRQGASVGGITLFALGGVAEIHDEPTSAGNEFKMAAAGPAMSMLLAGLFLAISASYGLLLPLSNGPGIVIAEWLGFINGVIVVFNLIPAFPMDGGRIFRSLVWALTRDEIKATWWALMLGAVIAALFVAFGLGSFLLGQGLGSLWITIIGGFLFTAQRSHAAVLDQKAWIQRQYDHTDE